MVEHQQNSLRIEELKQITASLDETIKSQIRLLAELRKELLAIPATDIDDSRQSFTVDEVLSYAKFIGPTTVPPTFRRKATVPAKLDEAQHPDTRIANGMTTPPPGTTEADTTRVDVGEKAMNAEDKAWLDPRSHQGFQPWPSHDDIARGKLADIQRMVERGVDPASILTAEEQAEADARKKEEEEQERIEQEERERRRAQLFDTGRRRPAANDVFNPDD